MNGFENAGAMLRDMQSLIPDRVRAPRADLAKPRVSVILPVRNGMPYLPMAVESILSQTFGDFELIIVDDASTDSTPECLAELTDPRVRVIRNERNLGVSKSLNKALALARGEYIARQDADDLSFPKRLAKQVAFLDSHPEVGLLGSDLDIIDQNGVVVVPSSGVPHADIDIKWQLLFKCPMPHSSIMVRPQVLAQFGCYPEAAEFRYAEDYELWSRVTEVIKAANLPDVLIQWRANMASVSSRHDEPQREQMRTMSLNNIRRTMGVDVCQQAFDDANALFRSARGRYLQLPPARLRAALSFLEALQESFYAKYRFSRAEVAAHRRRCHWIWGKHLLMLSLRGRAGLGPRLTLLLLGIRYLLHLTRFFDLGVSRSQPQGDAASVLETAELR